MNTISECPVCKRPCLVQKFKHEHFDMNTRIGGDRVSRPPILDGCYCEDCGNVNIFNVKGECPACKGSGKFITQRYHGIMPTSYSTSSKCDMCDGTGKI